MRRATRRLQLVSIQSYYDNCCVVYSLDNTIHLLLKDLGSWDEENFVKWIAIKCSDVTFNITIFLISDILFNIISKENNSNQGKVHIYIVGSSCVFFKESIWLDSLTTLLKNDNIRAIVWYPMRPILGNARWTTVIVTIVSYLFTMNDSG